MNSLRNLTSILPSHTAGLFPSTFIRSLPRALSSLITSQPADRHTSQPLLPINSLLIQPCRNYKVKTVLKKHCKGCYLEKRFGRLYVECTLKGRHKQMMKQSGLSVFKDDYSKGPWKEAVHYGYLNNEHFYKRGDQKFSKYNWLDGKLGKTV
ncbi:54S ribosomal protein L36 [Mactra antiquata]